jgi:hypothetical protein
MLMMGCSCPFFELDLFFVSHVRERALLDPRKSPKYQECRRRKAKAERAGINL